MVREILTLRHNQVYDISRLCFRVGMRVLGTRQGEKKQQYKGRPVMVDSFGVKFIVLD